MVTSVLLAAVCDTVRVQNCPCATETLMSGLLDVAVNDWLELVLPLPFRDNWYPWKAGTVRLAIGASEAVNNRRALQDFQKGTATGVSQAGSRSCPMPV